MDIEKSSASPPGPAEYATTLARLLSGFDWSPVEQLIALMRDAWRDGRSVFICGNGGSAANAIHWANDFVYPVAARHGRGLRISALTANTAILTCVANDTAYENIFSYQLTVGAAAGDLLVVLSGSGNSPNILRAVATAREIGMKTVAVLGFDGGACRAMVDLPIHFVIDDMQIAEDAQLIVNHMVMQALCAEDSGIE